jgi:N-acetylneuraminic acid mutarotase
VWSRVRSLSFVIPLVVAGTACSSAPNPADLFANTDAGGIGPVDPNCVPSPTTCAGKCGSLRDVCGAVVDCGGCTGGDRCGGGGPNVCGTGTCTPSCDGKACGESDGCSRVCTQGCPAASKLVLFGGTRGASTSLTYLTDTWEYDGSTWTSKTATPPAGRVFFSMIALGGKVVLFGGAGSTTDPLGTESFLGDTWEYNGTAWTNRTVSGPPARADTAMATLDGSIVLFGGNDASGSILADTWTYDGATWTQRTVTGGRYGHAMATLNGKVVLFGGVDANGVAYGDTWEWDGSTWTQRNVTGPSPRGSHHMATLGGKIVLFGGASDFTASARLFGDTWEWDGSTWTQRTGTQPPPRAAHAMATANGKIVLFGGTSGVADTSPQLSDTWEWDGSTWTQRNVGGPGPRSGHSMAAY